MPVYYIFQRTGNVYTLKGKYTCHEFDPPDIIPECELFCPAKFTATTRNTYYWYHGTDEEIHVMVKLKQVLMPFIGLIQYNNTTNNLPSRFKG